MLYWLICRISQPACKGHWPTKGNTNKMYFLACRHFKFRHDLVQKCNKNVRFLEENIQNVWNVCNVKIFLYIFVGVSVKKSNYFFKYWNFPSQSDIFLPGTICFRPFKLKKNIFTSWKQARNPGKSWISFCIFETWRCQLKVLKYWFIIMDK